MFKFFTVLYIIILLITASLIIYDYSDCYKMRWPSLTPNALGVGMSSLYGGLFWPTILPGMLILYNEKEKHFCIN